MQPNQHLKDGVFLGIFYLGRRFLALSTRFWRLQLVFCLGTQIWSNVYYICIYWAKLFRKKQLMITFFVNCRYLLPDHVGPCHLRISFSAHNDLNVKFQSHRSRYLVVAMRGSCYYFFYHFMNVKHACVQEWVSAIQWKSVHVEVNRYIYISKEIGLLELIDLVFSHHRDYTNPYLPVAPSAIDGGGQVST